MSLREETYFWGPGYAQNMPKVSCVTMDQHILAKKRVFSCFSVITIFFDQMIEDDDRSQ